jgi:hypothetical protein
VSDLDERNLRDMLEIAVGEPPHWMSLDAIRQRGIRRRITQAGAVGLAAVLAAGLGATLSAYAARNGGPATIGNKTAAGPPRYYVQDNNSRSRSAPVFLVRARTTGKVVSVVRSPKPSANCGNNLAAAGTHTFFMTCEVWRKEPVAVLIYQFEVTNSGRATAPTLIKGGTLGGGIFAGNFAASPDGSHVAVEELRPSPNGNLYTNEVPIGIAVIDTRTGHKAMWRTGPYVPGKIGYDGASDISFTSNGSELVLLETLCPRTRYQRNCTSSSPTEVRAFGPADRGGSLQGGQLLLRESAFKKPGTGLIDAFITPDGAALTSVLIICPKRGICTLRVAKVALRTGRVLANLYQVRTGTKFEGVFERFFSADPTGRWLILDAGAQGKKRVNGWISHGRIVPLNPADGNAASYEAW